MGFLKQHGNFETAATIATRVGYLSRQWWARAGLAYALTPAVALGISAGRAPSTPWTGQPPRSFGTLFIRLNSVSRRTRPAPAAAPGVLSFSIRYAEASEFLVQAPLAHSVDIAGDFNGWQPHALSRQANGQWSGRLPLPAGVYHVVVRVDAGPWLAPPGMAVVPDEFGGESGVFEVKPGTQATPAR